MATEEIGRLTVRCLKLQLTENRLKLILPAAEQTRKLIEPLSLLDIPKEIEPTTYLSRVLVRKRERET